MPVCDPVRVDLTRTRGGPVSDLAQGRPNPSSGPIGQNLLEILSKSPTSGFWNDKIKILSNRRAPAPLCFSGPACVAWAPRGALRAGVGSGAVLVVWPSVVGCGACRSWPASAPALLVCLGGPPASSPRGLPCFALSARSSGGRLVLCAPPYGSGGQGVRGQFYTCS